MAVTNKYVTTNGDNTNSGDDWDNAWLTLQHADDWITAGGHTDVHVHVEAGTYNETLTIGADGAATFPNIWYAHGGNVIIFGGNVRNFCINQADKDYVWFVPNEPTDNWVVRNAVVNGFYFEGVGCRIENMIVRNNGVVGFKNGTIFPGTGIRFASRLINCDFYNNGSDGLKLMETEFQMLTIVGCRSWNNGGSGIYVGDRSYVDIEYSLIYNNTNYGIICETGTQQKARASMIKNCTIYGNGDDGIQAEELMFAINNIIAHNGGYGIDGVNAVCLQENDWNCLHDNTSGASTGITLGPNTIQTDPLFIDEDNVDFRLQRGSPCIGTGFPNSNSYANLNIDIGAHQYHHNEDLTGITTAKGQLRGIED